MSTRKVIFPDRPHALYRRHGYSPAVLSGDLLFISGMVGAREDGTPEPKIADEIRLAFDNLLAVLAKAGCGFDDVVDLTFFMTEPDTTAGLMIAALATAFPQEPKPNATALGVTWLSGFRFEIKAIARVPQASP